MRLIDGFSTLTGSLCARIFPVLLPKIVAAIAACFWVSLAVLVHSSPSHAAVSGSCNSSFSRHWQGEATAATTIFTGFEADGTCAGWGPLSASQMTNFDIQIQLSHSGSAASLTLTRKNSSATADVCINNTVPASDTNRIYLNTDAVQTVTTCGADNSPTVSWAIGQYRNWTVTWFDGSGNKYVFDDGGAYPVGAATYSGQNGAWSSTVPDLSFTLSPQATAFANSAQEIRAALVDDALRNLTSTMAANQRLIRDARGRMVETQQALSGCTVDEPQNNDRVGSELDTFECTPSALATRNHVPFDVDGAFALNGTTLSTSGSFFEQTGNYEGTQRRLFFGDFDVQHDGDTGSSTATITARVAWEQMTSDSTMLGYFIGGELASSNIAGAFEGDQDRFGVTAGGYAVHQLSEEVYLDGFLSYGIGRNNLDMANDVLALTSEYTTRTATAGASLSGVYDYQQYEFRPELSFSYGMTWIGNVGFTGRAYGLIDDTLSMDAGNVSIANVTLRPEIVWALDADTVSNSNGKLSFAPRAICERTISTTRIEDCGGGAELGLSSTSDDGLSNAEFRVLMDRVGNSERTSYTINLEHRF